MDNLPHGFMDIISSATVAQRKSMLVYLNHTINKSNTNLNDTSINFTDHTSHTSNFLNDAQLKETIIAEVTSMGILNKKSSKKLNSQWLSRDSRDYCFNDSQKFKHPPKPITDYPGIFQLLESVNSHEGTTHDLDAAFILGYTNSASGLNFHHDGEKLIDQHSSIATVSFGNERCMEFCRQGGSREAEYSFNVKDGDLAVMKPALQSISTF